MNAIDEMACATPGCDNRGKPGLNIVGYGSFATKSGRRRRYRCTVCRGTLSTNTGTAYSGLRCTRREFDQVASLRVEGVSISATARVTGHSRNTVARWLERASTAAKHFNDRMLRDFDLIELQADELCTFIGNKSTTVWLFATIEVSSRLWASSVLGRRSDRNARAVIEDVICRGRVVGCPLIATDGFEYYVGAVGALLGSTCVYGQVLKTRRNNRVVRVERRVKIGTANRLKAALWASEDSETLNTSFVERLNLTIRQASAYLRRRSPCHARDADQLRSHVELVRCHYNFVRPHRALRFGRENEDPSHAGPSGEQAIGPERHLHRAACPSARVCGGRRNCRGRVAAALMVVRTASGGLINSERRKHPRAADSRREGTVIRPNKHRVNRERGSGKVGVGEKHAVRSCG